MKLAIITLTKKAKDKSKEIKQLLTSINKFNNIDIFTLLKYSDIETISMDNGFKDTVSKIFNDYDALYFIMASGIVVRTISPFLRSKDIDPAVITSDEDGQFIVSLLSGHLGGANELASEIAKIIGGVAVISTASDVSGTIAVDTIAMKLEAKLKDLESAKDVTALIVNGESIELRLPSNMIVDKVEKARNINPSGIIVYSNKEIIKTTQIIPKNIILGIGCKRGTLATTILDVIKQTMRECNLHMDSIKHIATVDVKADEIGLLKVANYLKKELIIISREDIKSVQDRYQGSDFVEKTIGVKCVSAPVAYLSSNKKGKFLVEKKRDRGITISILEEN
ncbi:MAG: cobalt-precorrin 5A hydrolase [Psychrilyobacter sp.]|nr:cobalt-precorrin 5A hydrolase [Psychrilyobacter sp.]